MVRGKDVIKRSLKFDGLITHHVTFPKPGTPQSTLMTTAPLPPLQQTPTTTLILGLQKHDSDAHGWHHWHPDHSATAPPPGMFPSFISFANYYYRPPACTPALAYTIQHNCHQHALAQHDPPPAVFFHYLIFITCLLHAHRHLQPCAVSRSEVLGRFYNPNTTPKRQRESSGLPARNWTGVALKGVLHQGD